MALYKHTQGSGAPMVLLHGWALNSRFWDDIATHFASRYEVTCIDLPGHGKSSSLQVSPYDLDHLTDAVIQHIQPGTVLVGWSLGGMVALNIAARFPDHVKQLILTATSPQFFKSQDWPHGIDDSVIQSFADDLIKDYRATIMRFLAIQALGSDSIKQQIKQLREKVFINGEPSLQALTDGLNILLTQNLRSIARQVQCDSQIILGEKDTLIPVSSGAAFKQLLSRSNLHVIISAAHAPFISHNTEFISVCEKFLYEQ